MVSWYVDIIVEEDTREDTSFYSRDGAPVEDTRHKLGRNIRQRDHTVYMLCEYPFVADANVVTLTAERS